MAGGKSSWLSIMSKTYENGHRAFLAMVSLLEKWSLAGKRLLSCGSTGSCFEPSLILGTKTFYHSSSVKLQEGKVGSMKS